MVIQHNGLTTHLVCCMDQIQENRGYYNGMRISYKQLDTSKQPTTQLGEKYWICYAYKTSWANLLCWKPNCKQKGSWHRQTNMFDVPPAHNSLKQGNVFVTSAFHLCFRIHHYRGSRKSEWTRHINFWYM